MSEGCYLWLKTVTCDWWLLPVSEGCYLWFKNVTCDGQLLPVSESCYLWLKTVTCDQQLSPVSESYYLWLKTVTCDWRLLPVSEDCHLCLKTGTCDWRLLPVSEGCMNESCSRKWALRQVRCPSGQTDQSCKLHSRSYNRQISHTTTIRITQVTWANALGELPAKCGRSAFITQCDTLVAVYGRYTDHWSADMEVRTIHMSGRFYIVTTILGWGAYYIRCLKFYGS